MADRQSCSVRRAGRALGVSGQVLAMGPFTEEVVNAFTLSLSRAGFWGPSGET